MPDAYSKTKGTILSGYTKFIRKKWGAEGLAECSRAVGMDLAGVNEEKWYSSEQIDTLLEWVADTKGMPQVRRMGHAVVAERGVISVVARLAGFRRVLERGTDEFRENINFGEVKIDLKDKSAVVTMVGVSGKPATCEAWVGALEGIMAITNTKGTVQKTRCQCKGDPACVYDLEWK